MDVKFGKSNIVINGKIKEIQTRSISVSTEDLHKHVISCYPNQNSNHGQYNPQFSYLIPFQYLGGHLPHYCCGCQMQYFTFWQSYFLNGNCKNEYCYCKNMYMQQNYMNNLYYHPYVPNNPMICSCPSNQSCDISKCDTQKNSTENFKSISTNVSDNTDTNKNNQGMSLNSPTDSRRNTSLSASEKPSISRIPKLSSSNFNVSSLNNEENLLSPKEMVEYTNHFLHFPKYRKREELTSDEDPGEKLYLTRTTSERTMCSDFSKNLCSRLKFCENHISDTGLPFKKKLPPKVDSGSSGDSNVNMTKTETKDLNHLLKPNKNFMKEDPEYEKDEIGETRQRLMGNQLFDTISRKTPNQISQKCSGRLPQGRPCTPTSDQSGPAEDVPMMMMINTLVKKHPPSNDSKLNQLLNHIEKESNNEKSPKPSEALQHRFRKRPGVQRRTSPTENLKCVKTTSVL